MKQQSIAFNFTSRYFQLGEIDENTERLIFVLHGYGQQAKYFLRKFNALNQPETCIIAPEGLSKFYLEGFSGRVGATWMTKEDRLTDIKNYISYLNAIYKDIKPQQKSIEVSIIGFSQGAATACRWAVENQVNFDKLILWSGIFPPDMDLKKASKKLRNKSIYYVYGTDDPFINEEKLTEMDHLSKKLQLHPTVITFSGGHDLHKETLEKLFL